jgi:hypothetical protein
MCCHVGSRFRDGHGYLESCLLCLNQEVKAREAAEKQRQKELAHTINQGVKSGETAEETSARLAVHLDKVIVHVDAHTHTCVRLHLSTQAAAALEARLLKKGVVVSGQPAPVRQLSENVVRVGHVSIM